MEKSFPKSIINNLDLQKFEEILHFFEENKDKPLTGDLPADFEERMEKIEAMVEEYRKTSEEAIVNAKALIKEVSGKEYGAKEVEEIARHPEKIFGKKDAAILKKIAKFKEKLTDLEADFEMKRKLINERAQQEGRENEGKEQKSRRAKNVAKRKNWRSV